MCKIKIVEFNNFRAFNGKETFDFRNKLGEPADFVCIYGPNGMGKTSFFDGIEWFSFGKIYRFDEVKSELKKYKGSILTNRHANEEKAYVKVIFSNDEFAERTVISRRDSNNDYLAGRLKPKKSNNSIDYKQILPHSKIDGFVYAKSPEKKYEEWGSFWDLDGSQRELFNKVYKINKLTDRKIEQLMDKKTQTKEELDKLLISEDKINYINKNIGIFNKESIIEDIHLSPITKNRKNMLVLPYKNDIESLKNLLNIRIDNETLNEKKVRYLITFHNQYYNEKNMELNKQYKEIRKDLEYNKELFDAGKEWFDEYFLWNKIIDDLEIKYKSINIKELNLESQNKELEKNNEELKGYFIKRKILIDNSNYFREQSNRIYNSIHNISSMTKLKENKEEILTKLVLDKTRYENQISIWEESVVNDNQDEFLICEEKDDDIQYDLYLKIKKSYKLNLKNINFMIDKKNREIKKEEGLYKSSLKSYNKLEDISIKVKNYIEENNLTMCPICKTQFNHVDVLLSLINIDEQSRFCEEIYVNIQNKKTEKEKLLLEKNKLIKQWNDECNKNKEQILILKDKKSNEINIISNEINIINNKIKEELQINREFKEELMNINLYEGDFSLKSIEEWMKDTNLIYEKEINKIKSKEKNILEKKRLLENEIIQLKDEIKSNENKYDIFLKDSVNKNIIEKLKKIHEVEIREWMDFDKFFDKIKSKYIDISKEIENNNYILGCSSIISECNIDKNENLDFKKNIYEDYELQIFDKHNVDIKKIVLEYEQINELINNLKYKLDILINIDNELNNYDYNRRYQDLSNKIHIIDQALNKYESYKNKFEYILASCKKYIEANVESVLGSKSMNQIYSIIEPNKEFKNLNIEIEFNDNDAPGLYIKGKGDNNDICPEYFFSSAQLNTVALSMFLGGALSLDMNVKTIFIDDPVGHFDDINVLAFVDLMRNIVKDGQYQVIISTHDESFFNLLKNKLSSKYYNSKFMTFNSVGKVSENNY